MKRNLLPIKMFLTIGVGILMIFAFIIENETIFPSALVVFILLLTTMRKKESREENNMQNSKSFHYAVVTFSIIFAILNVFLSLFFPAIAKALAVDGLYDGEFVRVTINDAHEFCYSIGILLLIEKAFYYGLKRKNIAKLIVEK